MDWGGWGLCSVTCGGGIRYKRRECNMTAHGEYTSMCIGINSTSKPCHNFSCTPRKYNISIYAKDLIFVFDDHCSDMFFRD